MSNTISIMRRTVVAASVCAALALPLCTSAQVVHHDSNTLHKIGRAIQYPVKKDATNTSKVAHKAIGHNSVVNKKYGPVIRQKQVVTPGGHTQPVAPATATGHG